MKILYFQHVPFEDPANIALWARERGHAMSGVKLFDGETPPEPDAYDWLVVMGGPMNIYEHDQYPWLVDEKRAIRAAVDAGKRVLGVCLGAQLIADVLGGPVTPGAQKEIGWFPVRRTDSAAFSKVFKTLPKTFMAFHWHGDTFAIPPGATRVAESDACPNQAFEYDGGRVVGLQFHLESSTASIGRLIENCAHEIIPAPYVQSAETMQTQGRHIPEISTILSELLDNMVEARGR